MLTPGYDDFVELAGQSQIIPVYRECIADVETPVSVLSRFADDAYAFLLESVEGGERWGRYSIIGIHPYAVFTVEDGQPILRRGSEETLLPVSTTAFGALREVLGKRSVAAVPGLPRFIGGAVGSIGYETAGEFERLPAPKTALAQPTTTMLLTDELVVFDNVRHTLKIVVCSHPDQHGSLEEAYGEAIRRIDAIEERLRQPVALPLSFAPEQPVAVPEPQSNMTRQQFCASVQRAKEYIGKGDVIQVVLSQRFSAPLPAPPLSLYRALRLINPSPYTFFLKFGTAHLVGSSPEVMVRLSDTVMELRPIAGTRPRGGNEQEDRRLADELLADEKERAEHVMLVDLGRNDLGRVAVSGSVQVRDFMTVERYSHVMHIVSHIQGRLAPEHDAFDLIAATFPAGTLTGAPKIRAMEIINELEPQSRGAYGGAVGYIGYDGNMDLAITIRTLETDGAQVAVQAGAGIVYDSDPEREYEETVNKARGMVRALELAAHNLELQAVP